MPGPRSTLFPYTTLFRSVLPDAIPGMTAQNVAASMSGCAGQRCMAASAMIGVGRSGEGVSRDAGPEIYPLSLHDALPICITRCYSGNDGTECRCKHEWLRRSALYGCLGHDRCG